MATITHDPVREAEELREQLGSDRRRLLVFFGAGTSQAVGIDGVAQLTKNVRADLSADQQGHYDRFLKQAGDGSNLEHVLNRVRLCREMIGGSATTEADVYDPFLGSGTTLIAAETSGRVCLGMDLEPRYVDVAVRRWQAFPGKTAYLSRDGRSFEMIAAERAIPNPEANSCDDKTG